MDGSLDFLSSVLEEIALEGLDGITLPSLWVRLENRISFPLALDEASKSFIWECVSVHKDIDLYELPDPRPVLKIFDRYLHIDTEFGLVAEPPVPPEEIYPMKMIELGPILGSCTTFETRSCVTSLVRHGTVLVMSLKQVQKRWPDKLVLVSSVKSRLLALIGTEINPLIELTKEQYCLLERIGRSRYHGEVSQGESGILALNCSGVKEHLHYYAGKLMAHNLIIKQKHVLRLRCGKTVTGSLFHLTRFYQQRKIKCHTLLECIHDALKNKPGQRETWDKLQEELGIPVHTFRKLLKKFAHKWFKLILVPYRELYPDSCPIEYNNKAGEEKSVKMLQMTRSYLEDEDTLVEEDDNDKNTNPHFDANKVFIDKPVIIQVYDAIRKKGPNGASLAEVRQAITLPRLDIRTHCRLLAKRNEVVKFMQDRGRQRFERYVAKEFASELSIADFSNVAVSDSTVMETNGFKEEGEDVDSPTVQEELSKIFTGSENLDLDFQNIVSEVVELKENMVSRKGKVSLLTNALLSIPKGQVFPRLKRRANLLVSYINRAKFTTIPELSKVITMQEAKEGYQHKFDKKSLLRLLDGLRVENLVKVYKASFKLNNIVKQLQFVCHPTLDSSDLEFRAIIEQAKFKSFCGSAPKKDSFKSVVPGLKPKKTTGKARPAGDKEDSAPATPLTLLSSHRCGYPKFIRMKSLHLVLSYLVNHYDGECQQEDVDKIVSYHPSKTWKRFIPPLPQQQRKGWCILSDAISRIPVSLFTKIVGTRCEVQELNEMLKDPIKRHYLIRHLPLDMRNHLLCGRRYLFQISDVLNRLCQVGLVSLGPRVLFEKDQVFVYVHRKAQIKDTSVSPPGYLKIDDSLTYELKKYEFESVTDVENYWIDLESVCHQTPLGKYSTVAGQKIVILDPNQKPELVESMKNKEFDEVVDEGITPGDGLGAAGLDTSFYAHYKRNWHGPYVHKNTAAQKTKFDNNSLKFLLEKGAKNIGVPSSRVRLQRLTKQVLTPAKKHPAEKQATSPSSPPKKMKTELECRRKIRVIKTKTIRGRQQFYDAKDQSVLSLIKKMRAGWSPQEDTLLLLCKVTSVFLDPHSKLLVVPFTVIRDVVHEKFPELSYDKTSRACQRRLRHILVNSQEARYSVDMFLGEAKQDMELMKEFNFTKPPRTREDEWRSIFLRLLGILLQKFSSAQESKEIELPETIDLLKLQYNVVSIVPTVGSSMAAHSEPQTGNDIRNCTVGTLMLSSFAMEDDIKFWSYILYKIYEQYDESMLKSVIGEFSKRQLIARHKSYLKSKSKQPDKRLSSIPFRYSITYHNTFLQKYPLQIHEDACKILKQLDGGRFQLDSQIPAGYTATVLSLAMSERLKTDTEIPDPIVIFDKSFSECQDMDIIQDIMREDDDSQDFTSMLNRSSVASPTDETELSEEPVAKRQRLENEEIEITANPNIFSTSNISIRNTLTEESKTEVPTLSNCSRLAYYMLHVLSKPKRDATTTDELSVIPCTIHCELISERDASSAATSSSYIDKNDIDELVKHVVASYTAYIPQSFLYDIDHKNVLYSSYTCSAPSAVSEGEDVFDIICSFGSRGIPYHELLSKFTGEMSLTDHLTILSQSKLVLRLGVVQFRYVGVMHSKHWLISSFVSNSSISGFDKDVAFDSKTVATDEHARPDTPNNNSSDKEASKTGSDTCKSRPQKHSKNNSSDLTSVLFIPRPWRKPDGTLNSDTLVKWLRTLLSYIMSMPGVMEGKICERFSLPLPPVHILELLEILVRASCITRSYVTKTRKSSLFLSCNTSISSNMKKSDDDVHYESNPEAMVQMRKLSEGILFYT